MPRKTRIKTTYISLVKHTYPKNHSIADTTERHDWGSEPPTADEVNAYSAAMNDLIEDGKVIVIMSVQPDMLTVETPLAKDRVKIGKSKSKDSKK